MDTNLLAFLVSAAVVAVLVFPLGKALRRYPVAFYAAAVALTVLYLWAIGGGVRMTGVRMLAVIMQKGYLASLMLGVVMFCGCFDEGTWIRKRLQPIRGELSILSFIFILGHLATYLPTYLGMLDSLFGAHANVAASFVLAMVLTVVFAALTALSFRVVRRAIDPHLWRNLQRASYVMLALLVLHVVLALWRSAVVSGQARAVATLAVYALVAVAYAAMRIAKALRDARRRPARPSPAQTTLRGHVGDGLGTSL